MPKRDDEVQLWESFGKGTPHRTPREANRELGIPWRRVEYLCEKWCDKGVYDYGVAADLGWKWEDHGLGLFGGVR
jgi:hypothetical protein